jgi:hypothetical protein
MVSDETTGVSNIIISIVIIKYFIIIPNLIIRNYKKMSTLFDIFKVDRYEHTCQFH